MASPQPAGARAEISSNTRFRFFPVPVVRTGRPGAHLAELPAPFPDEHQAIGVLEGQGAQQHCVDDAKHGSVGADAQRRREQCNEREAWSPGEGVERVAQVVPHRRGFVQAGCHCGACKWSR
jgi:hypothetical protein